MLEDYALRNLLRYWYSLTLVLIFHLFHFPCNRLDGIPHLCPTNLAEISQNSLYFDWDYVRMRQENGFSQ